MHHRSDWISGASSIDAFLHEARKRDRVLNPHPITCAPMEIVRKISESAARADPGAPLHLAETRTAWRAFVLDTTSIWKTHTHIYICVVGDGGVLKAFPAFLFSKSRELDVTMIGTHAPRSVVDEPSQNSHRIRTLEIHLYSSHYIRQHTEEISLVIWSGTLIKSAR